MFLEIRLAQEIVILLIPHSFREHSPADCFFPDFVSELFLPPSPPLSATNAAPLYLWTATVDGGPCVVARALPS